MSPESPHQWSRIVGDNWVWIAVLSFLATFPVQQLAFPSSLSDCQTPTLDGIARAKMIKKSVEGNKGMMTGTQIFPLYTTPCPLCESPNWGILTFYAPPGKTDAASLIPVTELCLSSVSPSIYECLCRRKGRTVIACSSRTLSNICQTFGSLCCLVLSLCIQAGNEGSAENGQKETSTCDICQFGAECDVDAEDVWCVCNIDCSHISFNPVCASDGRSYDNPCQVKEASCQRQERIEVKFLGHCQGDMITGTKAGDGQYARTDYTEEKPEVSEVARGLYIPCPEHYKNYCVHGDCEYPNMLSTPSCSCHSGFSGPQCDTKEYNVLYVVPGSGKLRYVLIASVIGTLQVAIICVVVLCITRKCPRTNRINRQKQNTMHYNSENTLRASTRLI
ncbi:tomoregulin-2-like [Cyprinus carpio]|uniref:Tomoregulin-2-like n=1 Tax=Cyprinus carpio TaxID=7962 RepID=A0A9Q9WN58_CYPCA|nr:tomoregulin-2-like [Cyprinus carpio]